MAQPCPITVHRVTCSCLGDLAAPPAGGAPCGCPTLDLHALVRPEVFAPYGPGAFAPLVRAQELLAAAGKVPPPSSSLEFLLATTARVPVELRAVVVHLLMERGPSLRLDTAGRTMLSATLLGPS